MQLLSNYSGYLIAWDKIEPADVRNRPSPCTVSGCLVLMRSIAISFLLLLYESELPLKLSLHLFLQYRSVPSCGQSL